MTRPDDPTYTEAEVRACLEREVPALDSSRVRHLARGWDHDVFVVGEAWAFRFARNIEAAAALAIELPLLPRLAPQLPAAIPIVVHSGAIAGRPELRFAGHRLLPGTSLCDAGADASPAARARLAPALAQFVRALHAIEPPRDLRPDPLGRLDVARRGPSARAALERLRDANQLDPDTTRALLAALDRAEACELPAGQCIVHADLHTRNLLVEAGALSGVIDWVDVCVAHPALDLAAAFEVLPPSAHPEFFDGYGGIDEPTRRWAQWRAITHTTVALAGAIAREDDAFARACRVALGEMAEA